MTTVQHEWWGELRHGGMLVAPQFLDPLIPVLPELDEYGYDRLRSAWLRLDAVLYGGGDLDEARRDFASQLLETFLGLDGWQKASSVAADFKATSVTGDILRPNWVLPELDGDGALLAVWFDGSDTVGRGRGVRAQAKLVELLRATGIPLGLLTNGRQFRLVHAGPDYDAWAEWDAQTWFDESEGRETLRGLVALIQAESDETPGRLRALIRTIHESRNRQGDLAQVLGEQVRQGIELLVREVDHKLAADPALHRALWTDPGTGHDLSDDEALAAIYQAATRVVMRLVLVLYAEARDLLPANVEAYHDSYGVCSLYDTLARADREGRDALADASAAWPRILSLFRLVYFGSGHADLPVRAYGGQLFRPGDAESPEPVLRALAALEAARPADAIVYRLLRLLKVGKVKVRAGRGARWVAGAVDFSDLRTEYVGIVYEGLLDYELRRAGSEDPIVLLNVGRQPALPLSRLSELTASELKELLKTFKKDAASAAGSDEDGDETAQDTPDAGEGGEPDDADLEGGEEEELVVDDDSETEDDARARVFAWARQAVEAAGMVRRPRGANPDLAAYEQKLDAGTAKLVAGVIAPGRLYLVASGGLRKGSGSFYTRPALSVPLAQRALEPLCYEREDDRLVPRAPDEILDLKVCEPAMGSGSFLVAALRYLVEALHRSLEHHGRIKPKGDRETVITLPFGAPATGEEREEVLDLPPEDERFAERLRVQLARHVVERCLYGVDFNPMAVELARLALWIETLDRELPFEYLDHKLKVGNSLVGCWLHLVDDYPIRALDREDTDGTTGERTKWLKQTFKDAKAELPAVIDAMGGATRLFGEIEEPVGDLVARVRAQFEALHDLPRIDREQAYRDLLDSNEYLALKQRMDTWCSLWFWPAGDVEAPMPQSWRDLASEEEATVDRLAAEHRFFHWEVEFPDAFTSERAGFDVVLGNPPWETLQPESLEFFSRHDPLYRTYGKTEALAKQRELFGAVDSLEQEWVAYQAGFKAMANVAKNAGDPFDVSLARGNAAARLAGGWEIARSKRAHLAHRTHPYRIQGSGKVYTYKLFVELGHHLLRDGGRLGMLIPSGLYTDKGATEIRKEFLKRCSWEWCYGFENRLGFFPIHRSFKFVPIVLQRGGSTAAIQAAFMRQDVSEWERPGQHVVRLTVTEIKKFAPASWSFMEFRDSRDQELVDELYGEHLLLGEVAASLGGVFSQEFNVSSDDKHFVSRQAAERQGLISPGADARDPRVRARLLTAGLMPLYEGKSFSLHDPYFRSSKTPASVSKFVPVATIETVLETKAKRSGTSRVARAWGESRLIFRNIARPSDQRTLIPCVMPPAVHGHSAATLDGLGDARLPLVALLGSLTMDYVVRMKVSANLSWFYLATLPIPDWTNTEFGQRAGQLASRLNAVGADFSPPHADLVIDPADRLQARLMLDALAADLFGLHPDDLQHLAARFPIYDRAAGGDHRFPTLAVRVYETYCADGPDAAERRAAELAAARAAAGVGFGLDELWQPEDGWEKANDEAREILAAGVAV
jgi:hypothetical protein